MPVLDATATYDHASGDIALFVVNRHQHQRVQLEVKTAGLGPVTVRDACVLTGPHPSAVATQEDPNQIVPVPLPAEAREATVTVQLPPVAWACIRLAAR